MIKADALNDRAQHDQLACAEIIKLKNIYAHVIDGIVCGRMAKDRDKIAALFTEDAIVDLSSSGYQGVSIGHDQIATLFLETMPAANTWMWHSFGNPIIDVDGDDASGLWTIYAHFLPRGQERTVAFLGRYDDVFARVNGVWKHQRLKLLTEEVSI